MNRFIKKIYLKILYLIWVMFLFVVKVVNYPLSLIGLKMLRSVEVMHDHNQIVTLASFYNELVQNNNKLVDGTSCLIFSMDRAIQLHALLSSLFEKLNKPLPIFVIYRSTTSEHEKAYQEVKSIFADREVTFIRQAEKSTFATQLIDILENIKTTKLFFLVDDILIIENIDTDDLKTIDSQKFILSLRLGKNLSFSYMARRSQTLPPFVKKQKNNEMEDKICWRWTEGQYDWSYPLSVDGHIFLTNEMLAMSKSIPFTSPNTYETNLQIFLPIFNLRYGLAYKKAKLFNIPCNKVQTDYNNDFGAVHQDELLARWQAGEQIDFEALYGFTNIGVHQDVAFNFKKRHEQ